MEGSITAEFEHADCSEVTEKEAVYLIACGLWLREQYGLLSSRIIECPLSLEDLPFMSLTAAAYWIASECGSREFNLNNLQEWQAAFALLMQAIEKEKLDVYGRRGGHGVNLKIDANEFVKLKISYPYVGSPIDFAFGGDGYLDCSYGIVKPEEWHAGLHEKICQPPFQCVWSHLQVKGEAGGRGWPFNAVEDDSWPKFYLLPPDPPKGKAAAEAHRRLKVKYRNGQVPRLSRDALARIINSNPDAVRRALGLRK